MRICGKKAGHQDQQRRYMDNCRREPQTELTVTERQEFRRESIVNKQFRIITEHSQTVVCEHHSFRRGDAPKPKIPKYQADIRRRKKNKLQKNHVLLLRLRAMTLVAQASHFSRDYV